MEAQSPPILSIVTLAYRDPEGLEKTAESMAVLLQSDFPTTFEFEWIVIDSSPEIHDVIFAKLDQWIPYLKRISEPANGIYPAMNSAILKSRGKVIWFLNSGDRLIDEKALREGLEYFKHSSPPELVIFGAKLFKNGKYLYPVIPHTSLEQNLLGINRVCHQAVLHARVLFDKDGLYTTDYKIISDYIHLFKAWRRSAEYKIVRWPLVAYDMGGVSANWKNSLKEFGRFARDNQLEFKKNLIAFYSENLRIHATKALTEGPLKKWISPWVQKIKKGTKNR